MLLEEEEGEINLVDSPVSETHAQNQALVY